jgi:hypothetical protein
LYGAGDYARQARAWYGFPAICTVLVSLAFTGGCAAVAAFFSPLLWRARYLAIATACMLLVVWFARGAVFKMYRTVEGSSVFLLIQMALWALGGLSVLGLALADVCSRRDARSWLLALWVFGTFSFTAFVNWIVNGRSILPMIPAVAILLARRLEQRGRTSQNQWRTGIGVALAASALLAVLVTQADFLYAMAVRRTVKEVRTEYASEENTMWFLGHWGFEYYMEAAGARAADARCGLVKPGDFVAVPARNPTFISMDPATLAPLGQCAAYGPRWLATMNDATGAGFYASFWGPLPFAFGRVPPEVVTVNVVTWPNVPPGQ